MILALIVAISGTTVVVGPLALYAGAKFRERIPIRVPTNSTRLADAETDLRLLEISRERRQVDLNIERDALVAENEMAGLRETISERQRRELVAAEGENHRVLEARLLDAARAAFPDAAWGTVRDADDLLALLGRCVGDLRSSEDRMRAQTGGIRDALQRARINGRLPKYLSDAAYEAGLL